jgi:ActR/RegA family two-component response regulator
MCVFGLLCALSHPLLVGSKHRTVRHASGATKGGVAWRLQTDLVLLRPGGSALNRNSSFHVPVVESMHATPVVPAYGRSAETGQAPASIIDVLAIGEDATVFRPLQRALRPVGWAVAHVGSVEAAVAYLQSKVAAVAVTEAGVTGRKWEDIVSSLRSLADAPEVVIVSWDSLPLQHVLRAGAFDVMRRPLDHSDLLWTVASAWHNWMSRHERRSGGGPCSDV